MPPALNGALVEEAREDPVYSRGSHLRPLGSRDSLNQTIARSGLFACAKCGTAKGGLLFLPFPCPNQHRDPTRQAVQGRESVRAEQSGQLEA